MSHAVAGIEQAPRLAGGHERIADFRKLLGERAWSRLPAGVRERFAASAHAGTTTYVGRMNVSATWLGRCLAQLCRLIGTPVAPFVAEQVPMKVCVRDRADRSGTVWERSYEFARRPTVVVSSTKCLDDDGTLLEALNAGLHMRLNVFEEDGALHFLSTGYFFRIGPWRIELPKWFPPGATHVIHEDLGGGRFRFTMRTEHRWWGAMYLQSGSFTAAVE